jgi:hypothetical protein
MLKGSNMESKLNQCGGGVGMSTVHDDNIEMEKINERQNEIYVADGTNIE